jgi:Cu/Zn superoxide dismutase
MKTPSLRIALGSLLAAACVQLYGCRSARPRSEAPPGRQAFAVIRSSQPSALRGYASLAEIHNGVELVIDLINAPPGQHRLRIREDGDCGSVYLPAAGRLDGGPLGSLQQEPQSAIDLGSIEIRQDGAGQRVARLDGMLLADGPQGVLGRTLVVHRGSWDGDSAGGILACGVIHSSGGHPAGPSRR